MKHTPGPRYVIPAPSFDCRSDPNNLPTIIPTWRVVNNFEIADGMGLVATVEKSVHASQRARLIAAAPELLEVSRRFVDGCERGEVVGEVFFSRLLNEARAIIAKTKGGIS